jgi:hypothetical protein
MRAGRHAQLEARDVDRFGVRKAPVLADLDVLAWTDRVLADPSLEAALLGWLAKGRGGERRGEPGEQDDGDELFDACLWDTARTVPRSSLTCPSPDRGEREEWHASHWESTFH